MDKDSNKIVPYITKEEFQNKIKSKYHSKAELDSAFDEAKRNGSFFQLMKASGKKLMWHTIEGDNVQAEDILKQFSRSAIKSARASDVPEGAIVLKEKESHPLNLSNLAIGTIAAAQVAVPWEFMKQALHASYKGWENSYRADLSTVSNAIEKLTPANILPDNIHPDLATSEAIQDKIVKLAGNVTGDLWSNNQAQTDIVNAAVNSSAFTMFAATSALAAGAVLLSKKPWSAASKFTFADGKALDRANDLIKETAQLMDKEFLERKQNPEKRYYIDEDSVKAYVAATPAAKLGPDDMLDGSNQIYVKETTKKIPDGAIEVKQDPELPPETNPYSFPSDEAWDQCKDLISKTLAQNRETEHGKHITAAAR